MKTLKLDHGVAELVRSGELATTWRVNDDKDLSVDDQVELIDKVEPKVRATWEIFGVATIDEVLVKRLGDLGEGELLVHGYVSPDEMYKTLRGYYGKGVGPETPVKIVQFRFEPYSSPRRLQPEANYPTKIAELKLYADGGSRGNPGPSASGFVLYDMDDIVVKKAGIYLGITTNNQAEYLALKAGLEEAIKLQAETVHVYLDSLLVVNQMKGIFKVKNRDLWPIHESIKQLTLRFKRVKFTHVPRELNKAADQMVNETLDEALKV
jgi:ribonuclease HI